MKSQITLAGSSALDTLTGMKAHVLAGLTCLAACQRASGGPPALADLFAGQAHFVVDETPLDTSPPSHMHFLQFLNDKIDGRYWVYYIPADGTEVLQTTTADGVHFGPGRRVLSLPQSPLAGATLNSFPGAWHEGDTFFLATETSNKDDAGDIALYTSHDGLNFQSNGLILRHQSEGWEKANIGTPSLYKSGSAWYLFYHGYDAIACRIGMASGPDLQHLTRASGGRPVIDVEGTGNLAGTAGRRDILERDGVYYMVYEISSSQGSTFSHSNWSTSIASSKDLLHWKLLGKPILPVVEGGFGNDGPAWFADAKGEPKIYFRNKENLTQRAMLQAGPPPAANSSARR